LTPNDGGDAASLAAAEPSSKDDPGVAVAVMGGVGVLSLRAAEWATSPRGAGAACGCGIEAPPDEAERVGERVVREDVADTGSGGRPQ
jgi:hypothetical protein